MNQAETAAHQFCAQIAAQLIPAQREAMTRELTKQVGIVLRQHIAEFREGLEAQGIAGRERSAALRGTRLSYRVVPDDAILVMQLTNPDWRTAMLPAFREAAQKVMASAGLVVE